jgi:hypothetical protein
MTDRLCTSTLSILMGNPRSRLYQAEFDFRNKNLCLFIYIMNDVTAFQSLFTKLEMTEKVLGSNVEKKEKVSFFSHLELCNNVRTQIQFLIRIQI